MFGHFDAFMSQALVTRALIERYFTLPTPTVRSMMRKSSWVSGAFLAVAMPVPASADAQDLLHWDELAVTARLDAEGKLHVDETHFMNLVLFDSRLRERTRVGPITADDQLHRVMDGPRPFTGSQRL